MKLPLLLASLVIGASSASATVTLQFNGATGSLQNFANASGVGSTSMVWGLIVDTNNNGFHFNAGDFFDYLPITPSGSSLVPLYDVWGNLTDDVFFVSPLLMNVQAATADGMPAGTNRVTSIASLPYGAASGITSGDPFAVVWLNSTQIPTGNFYSGAFGAVTNPGLVIPADSSTTSFAELFAGPDPLKTQDFLFGMPEPSTALLGLLGAVGLLRRRR